MREGVAWIACRPGRRALTVVALGAACLLSPPDLQAQPSPPLVILAHRDMTSVVLSATPQSGPEDMAQRRAVEDSLARGFRSQIVVQIRLYERTRGIASLFGDRLVRETVLTRVLRHEPIGGRYVLDQSLDGVAGEETEGPSAASLLDRFFTVSDMEMPLDRAGTGGLYLRLRYRLSPIRVSPQVGLIALLGGLGARSSDWVEVVP